jgi:arylsulfatase
MPSKVDGIAQQPLDGVSFARTFDYPEAPSPHHTQYFELYGNRAIYQDGWVAAARHGELDEEHPSPDYAHDRWELYDVADDFSEAHDVAAEYPAKLEQLQRLFDTEARKNGVYPLGGAGVTAGKPSWTEGVREFTYYPGTQRIPLALMPPLSGASFRITAKAVISEGGAQGVIVSYGARDGGFSLYVKDGRLYYENKLSNGGHEHVESDILVPQGEAVFTYEFTREGERKEPLGYKVAVGTGRLSINRREVGKGKLSGAAHVDMGTMGIGQEFGSPVSDSFRPPFKFSGGTLQQVKVELH